MQEQHLSTPRLLPILAEQVRRLTMSMRNNTHDLKEEGEVRVEVCFLAQTFPPRNGPGQIRQHCLGCGMEV